MGVAVSKPPSKMPRVILTSWDPRLCIVPPLLNLDQLCDNRTSEVRSYHTLHLPPCSLGPLPMGEVRCYFMRKFKQPVKRPTWRGNEASCQQPAPICQLWEWATVEANLPAPVRSSNNCSPTQHVTTTSREPSAPQNLESLGQASP